MYITSLYNDNDLHVASQYIARTLILSQQYNIVNIKKNTTSVATIHLTTESVITIDNGLIRDGSQLVNAWSSSSVLYL